MNDANGLAETTGLGQPFHVGMVVKDLESSMAQLGGLLGIQWAIVQNAEYAYRAVDGDVPTRHRYTYSTGQAPHLELIEGEIGSLWEPTTDLDLHHLGYWVDDLPASSARLDEAGCPPVATLGRALDAPKIFTYHRPHNSELWIELVDSRLKASFAPWLAGGEMGARISE